MRTATCAATLASGPDNNDHVPNWTGIRERGNEAAPTPTLSLEGIWLHGARTGLASHISCHAFVGIIVVLSTRSSFQIWLSVEILMSRRVGWRCSRL